jgi:hypothetical protein
MKRDDSVMVDMREQPPNGLPFSCRLKSTTLGGGMAESTNLIRKIAAIQPVGWSAMLGRLAHQLNGYDVLSI